MANKRKSIRPKLRFEVFKRDSFTCQYCGKSAPDVVLEIDHIKPVSKGGDNNIMNLITSCRDCNRGKSNVILSDKVEAKKQQKEAEELQERKNQLEMMSRWREELRSLDDSKVEMIRNEFEAETGAEINDHGKILIKQWVKRYSVDTILEAMDRAIGQYDDLGRAFTMIPKIAYYVDHPEDRIDPQIHYVSGILRNRLGYYDRSRGLALLTKASESHSIEDLKEMARNVRNWTQFRETMISWIEEGQDEQNYH